jgi:hypothetical protein
MCGGKPPCLPCGPPCLPGKSLVLPGKLFCRESSSDLKEERSIVPNIEKIIIAKRIVPIIIKMLLDWDIYS